MRKLILTTAAVAAAICLAGCGSGTLTDSRDGQTYKTVTIGKQTWMAENLNYKTDSSWCYNDSASYCKQYGRLYDWKTATTVCPKGWKLPDTADWNRLVLAASGKDVAGKKLKAKRGWKWNDRHNKNGNGTDNYGFSALPEDGYNSIWWTATTDNGSSHALYRLINFCYDIVDESHDNKSLGFSVRCVADSP